MERLTMRVIVTVLLGLHWLSSGVVSLNAVQINPLASSLQEQLREAAVSDGFTLVDILVEPNILVDPTEVQTEEPRPDNWPFTGSLEEGATYDLKINVTAEGYQVLTVCDEDCGDLDLALFLSEGDDNRPVMTDYELDATPKLELPVGRHTLQVQMVTCTREPCYFAVGVFRTP